MIWIESCRAATPEELKNAAAMICPVFSERHREFQEKDREFQKEFEKDLTEFEKFMKENGIAPEVAPSKGYEKIKTK